tara:strand:+ start:56 stop:244 length:189 start_codon:yes stop_codon:yes gene_type:complete
MIKTITWKNTEIRNYSASVEIPDDILNEGGDALSDYLQHLTPIEGRETDCEVIESFEDIEVE